MKYLADLNWKLSLCIGVGLVAKSVQLEGWDGRIVGITGCLLLCYFADSVVRENRK